MPFVQLAQTNHDLLANVSADDHHDAAHDLVDHAARAHANLSDSPADAHHDEVHAPESHSDTDITGPELETLSDGSDADALHDHTAGQQTKVENETRAAAAASGDVSYTGAGFTPKGVIIYADEASLNLASSWGLVGTAGDFNGIAIVDNAGTRVHVRLQGLVIQASTGNGADVQQALVKSVDADGITLTWTKIGNGRDVDFRLFYLG